MSDPPPLQVVPIERNYDTDSTNPRLPFSEDTLEQLGVYGRRMEVLIRNGQLQLAQSLLEEIEDFIANPVADVVATDSIYQILSPRTANNLHSNNIRTINQLMTLTEEYVMSVPNLNVAAWREIQEALIRNDFIKDPEDEPTEE